MVKIQSCFSLLGTIVQVFSFCKIKNDNLQRYISQIVIWNNYSCSLVSWYKNCRTLTLKSNITRM
jgi:hypothetical protein